MKKKSRLIKHQLTLLALLQLLATTIYAQQELPLYSGAIPNSTGYPVKEIIYTKADGTPLAFVKVSVPQLKIYLPENKDSKHTGLIIIPGGGYRGLAWASEGTRIAEAFVKQGIACFVLKYRLPDDSVMKDKRIGPLQDAQQAIRTVRMNAAKWNVDPDKVGVIGYSAGGHLASALGTHYNRSCIDNPEKISLRPDFMILVYPVISMKEGLTHAGSRTSLLGEHPTAEDVQQFSSEDQVDEKTPPAYLTQAEDDSIVSIENSIAFYQALARKGVPAEMHLYAKGNHGFTQRLPEQDWLGPMLHWMRQLGY